MDKNKFSKHYVRYGIIWDGYLPDKVRDEAIPECINDRGEIVNPDYSPLFRQWLEENNMPVEPYIIWCSW